jgi:hypothetical protein
MGIIERLRELAHAQPHGRGSKKEGDQPEKNLPEKDAALRRLRRKMRIFPKAASAPEGQGLPAGGAASANAASEARSRKPIVSVHGKDIEEDERKSA